jgi:hypothetical protein
VQNVANVIAGTDGQVMQEPPPPPDTGPVGLP